MRPSRTPPPPLASPRHASSRRAAGCGIEPSRAHSYALLFAGQERRVFDRWGHDLKRRIVGYRLGRGFSPRLSTRGRTYICGALPTLAAAKNRMLVPLLQLPPATPSRSPRTRLTGEQASETPPLLILYGRGAIRFLGSDYATARFCSSTSASPSSSPCRPTPTVPPLRRPRPTTRPPRMSRLLPPSPPPRGRLEGINH